MKKVIYEMKSISKTFPGVKALDGVDFNIYQGRVMALLGENGAGKSTLMKIVSGVYKKDKGSIRYEGESIEVKDPKDAQNQGICIIHQELNLIPHLSIAENIFLGREPKGHFGKIKWKTLYHEADKLLNKLKINKSSKMLVKDLSIGEQQMIEIAKALSFQTKIIIMDEPTDALTQTETNNLFHIIDELRKDGKSIVYISHRLEEIFKICDDVTVLRDGQFVREDEVKNLDQDQLIKLMVGRTLEEQFPRIRIEKGEEILKVENVSNEYIKNIDFHVHKGEILGIAGLMGSGRTELAKTLYGVFPKESGKVIVKGKEVGIKTPKDALEHGIAYVSEDRKGLGLILDLSVKENISIGSMNGWISKMDQSKETVAVTEYIDKLNIKTPSMKQKVKNLSGGNQQKVSIAKGLMTHPDVLILDEPTRGVDVGAKKEIYNLINLFKKSGMSIIMISSEMPEILGMSDRILVMYQGRITGQMDRSCASQERIMSYAVGRRDTIDE